MKRNVRLMEEGAKRLTEVVAKLSYDDELCSYSTKTAVLKENHWDGGQIEITMRRGPGKRSVYLRISRNQITVRNWSKYGGRMGGDMISIDIEKGAILNSRDREIHS